MALQHLDPLPLSVHHRHPGNSTPVRTSYGQRVVETFELDYMLGGDGEIVTEGVPEPTKPGTLFFRWPGMVVEGFAPYSCYYVRFLPRGGADGTGSAPEEAVPGVAVDWREEMPFPAVVHVRDAAGMARRFGELHRAQYREGAAGVLESRCILLGILLSIHEECLAGACAAAGSPPPTWQDRIRSAADWLEANPGEPRTLDAMAREAGYSRFAFCRRFREVVGEPPMAFGNRMRVRAAQRLLSETSDPVTAILRRCGFESEENFYRQFRRYAGTSPLAYRVRITGRGRRWIAGGPS